jgi:hypothetical protein
MTTTWVGRGGLLSDTNTIYAPSRPADAADHRIVEPPRPRNSRDEPKWAAWKVSTFVIAFNLAFWTGAYLLFRSIFG